MAFQYTTSIESSMAFGRKRVRVENNERVLGARSSQGILQGEHAGKVSSIGYQSGPHCAGSISMHAVKLLLSSGRWAIPLVARVPRLASGLLPDIGICMSRSPTTSTTRWRQLVAAYSWWQPRRSMADFSWSERIRNAMRKHLSVGGLMCQRVCPALHKESLLD